jgi:opacity protein-like surface antigen
MRCVVVAMLGLGLAQSALAADYGILRGSTGYEPPVKYRNWEGFYVGGQAGTGGGGADFAGESNTLVAQLVRESWLESAGVASWATSGKGDTGQALQYGAFIGYNGQWGDVVLGVELSYNHTDLSATARGGLGRILTSGNFTYDVDVSSTSTITLHDFGTFRARAGYAYGSFLPYLTGGVALGRASYSTVGNVQYPQPIFSGTPPQLEPTPPAINLSATEGKSNSLIYGWSAGLGMDWALTHNIFLRAEYEFIQFSQMRLNLNNARVGAGLKF